MHTAALQDHSGHRNAAHGVVVAATVTPADLEGEARQIINRYTIVSGGIGLVPLPFFDQVAIGSLIGKMAWDLGQLYGIPVSRYRTRAIVSAILGGAHTQWITFYVAGVLGVLFPGVGGLATATFRPVISGAVTYTIGGIFLKQFGRGATLEALSIEAARKEFQRGFEEGKAYMKKELSASKGAGRSKPSARKRS
jgi:uncharacterized protein (DUF697 family)